MKSFVFSLLLIACFLSISFRSSLCADTVEYTNCSQPITCGTVKDISYPFWGATRAQYCGISGFEVTCKSDVPLITMSDIKFRILEMVTTTTVKVAREDYWGTLCPSKYVDTTLNFSLFTYSSGLLNLSIYYGCSSIGFTSAPTVSQLCTNNNNASYLTQTQSVKLNPDPVAAGSCNKEILIPVLESASSALDSNTTTIQAALDSGFNLDVVNADNELCNNCEASGGVCGITVSTGAFMCYCNNSSSPGFCDSNSSAPPGAPPGSGFKFNWKLTIVVGVCSFVGTSLILVAAFCVIRGVSVYEEASSVDVETFIQNIGVKRYKFSAIRKITDSFKDKLGQGGFGDVYKGKLQDGCSVAVKVLKESKGNGQDFVNEVASISRTSHVNVVTLLGYCFEGKKKALIYEFMPNGSLEKFIYQGMDPLKATPNLDLKTLFQVSTGIARGLEYLHRGCNTRILHFDIKPHNILLDENFCPKISDFGLSRLCTRKESIISMLDARGTIGYIAPEICSRHFGGVSAKSDVYSYGMMILEMVGGRKNIDARVSNTSEIYFPDWIYKSLEQGSYYRLHNAVTDEEKEIARKMILVGLWCIQTWPADRPSMSRVIEMLEGSVEALQIPRKPVISSPVRSLTIESTTSSTS